MNELEIIRHRRIEGLSVFFDLVDYRTPHFHPEWEILWILEGGLSVTCDQRVCQVRAGEVLLFSPNQLHEFHKLEESCMFLCLQASPALLGIDRRLTADSVRPGDHLPALRPVRDALRKILRAYLGREEQYELYCVGQTCLLFHTLLRAMPHHVLTREEQERQEKRNRRLQAFIRFVDENYMHKIRLADFAEAEGVSLHYLSHFVKDALNQSFQDYVNSVRVNCACQLMAAGEERLLDICEESGFSDYRYFSKAFKRQFGLTPEEYRKEQRRPENAVVHHSLHSLERFYDDEQSKEILSRLSV